MARTKRFSALRSIPSLIRRRPKIDALRRRVVVTGIGALTVLGLNTEDTWAGLTAGRSGIARITQFDPEGFVVQIAGEVKGFDPTKYIESKEIRRMARCSQLAVAAAKEALEDCGLHIGTDVNPERVGVVMGTALGGFEMSDGAMVEFRKHAFRRGNPFALPAALPNAPGHHISTYCGAKGPLSTVVAACASGTQALGDGAEMIRRGKADVVFAGGVEAAVIEGAIASFTLMRVLSTCCNDAPERAQKPFDAMRDGFAYSEGCVVMMLEDYERAKARGAHIYAEILGMGVSSDAHHIAIPDPTGSGAIRSMRWALEDAGIDASRINYINAHGSATPTNDALETAAIKEVFGKRAYDIPVTSTKSMVGHAMGASGAIEALSTILTIERGIVPPTINLHTPDPACDLDYVPNVARKQDVEIALSNSFGLGGQNASIVLGRV
ncbi:MAG: beta-ketoacyl-ACP synthase II [Chloroflexi bacterium]|nr:beta-ketoacyl-ACP synthase II [Chloroflexota bacterium]